VEPGYSDQATTGVQFPAGAVMGFFSLLHRIQTGSGDPPASFQWVPGVNRPGREAD